MRLSILLATVLVFGLINSSAQSLHGRILCADDKSPVPYASLVLVGTGFGTATDPDGAFLLHLKDTSSAQVVRITCIGFKSTEYSVRALKGNGNILLQPETELLAGITVQTAKITTREILEEAIRHTPQNYSQSPFNMEFYSQHVTRDTLGGSTYTLESVFETYSEGYRAQARKNYRITQKRESGEFFMKESKHGMSQWPMVEVAFNDLCTKEPKLDVLTLDKLDEIKLELLGLEKYDGDTVFVIRYQHNSWRDDWKGTLFVSAKDHAIVLHRTEGSPKKDFTNELELRYRKYDGLYYPYSAVGAYLHEYKVDGKRRMLRISNRVVLRKIELKQVKPFADIWFPKHVGYDKVWWEQNYPRLRGQIRPATDHRLPTAGH